MHSMLIPHTPMSWSRNPTIRLISLTDPPQCALPALLGPAKQSACLSICNERLEVDSTAALRYFACPTPGQRANLRDGLDRFLERPVEDRTFQYARRLDTVFEMCLDARNSSELLEARVVTWRGIMTKIMLGFTLDMNISCHNGVLYLEEHGDPERRFDPDSEVTFMGHKFEESCTTSTPGVAASNDAEVDLHTLWNAAITRTLGSLKILLVGEVDCVKPGYLQDAGPEHYVELKTKNEAHCNRIAFNKWYMQSYLLGIPEIFVGFLDPAGVVRRFRTIPVQQRDIQRYQYKIDWGARVLHSLRAYCARAGERDEGRGALKVWRVHATKRCVDIREMGAEEVAELNAGGVRRDGIIPVSFIQGLQNRITGA
ncbi:hypothetical protein B0H17DRAFT_1085029 [Mycena rosella]|uniref:Decapping nuclease n=1 Tax=Mycena rosella TaxID=1033263 RepID=A0AAD7D002_MYCRO|nr:hypothetical protein B0H17DRAFT_1085029 [Mycena rosella]